ncbi:uncharacterized protein N7515_004349 [Penicillium bovifimosum]|uniref:D-xylose reductase [NAD(P)H] n=1 Tax=Penicillium bovifimosum TaxID=126998 RepID=A0A9W9GZX5_9EURO|nr:uncharacterized protein N7515_004349 [Penicillium bovifimosum]KAJ5135071.1 hypothetical protein N7515_004349 [Penicillium bovifimosum]
MAKLTLQTKHRLQSGHEIPVIGYGVYMIPSSATEKATLEALNAGFRHVRRLSNNVPQRETMRKSHLPILIRSLPDLLHDEDPPGSMGYEATKRAINSSLREASQEYFDLILIHAPYGGKEARLGSWDALVEAQKAGQTKAIGVSNYGIHHLEELESYIQSGGGGQIDVGQYELHPWLDHSDIVEWLQKRNIIVEAYSPLAHGSRLREPVLVSIGKKYGKTPAQVMIRWSLQMGFVPLPKSVTPQRIRENVEVFDFELDEEDMKLLQTGEYSPTDWDPTVDSD